jgi:hypothetical protein
MPPANSRPRRSTAEYYSILHLGVTKLSRNTAQTRRVLYDHARTILATQLQRQDPVQIAHNQLCLERAILQMEAFEQLAQHSSSQSKIDSKFCTRFRTWWGNIGSAIGPFTLIGNLGEYVRVLRCFKGSKSVQKLGFFLLPFWRMLSRIVGNRLVNFC